MENNFTNSLNGENSKENFHELLVCVDRVDGSLEFFDYGQNCWQSSSISLELSTRQLLCEVQWLQSASLLFAFGGRNIDKNPLNLVWSHNLNDTSSQRTAMTPMSKNRSNFSSVVFDNNIYALGGNFKDYDSRNRILRSCERYNSQLNQWKTIDSMNNARRNASAAIYNNCIYIAGGTDENGVTERSVEKYDFQSQTWSDVAPMNIARSHFALTPFAGRLWAIGGMDGDKQALFSVESYNFKSNKWKQEESLNSGRMSHSAIEFNGELYVVGGFKQIIKNAINSYVSKPTKITENYVFGKGWSENAMLQKNHPFAKLFIAYSINIKNITVFEQKDTETNNSSLKKFDQFKNNNNIVNETNKFILSEFENELKKYVAEVQPPFKKVYESVTVSGQTYLLPEKENGLFQQLPVDKSISLLENVADCFTEKSKQLLVCINKINGSVQFYVSKHKNWHSSPVSIQLPNEHYHFEFALLGSMLYAFGGEDENFNPTNKMWSRDLSDPSSQWTAMADMKQSRKWFSSVVLNDSLYALSGFENILNYHCSCERYCSQLNEWSTVADMNIDRNNASAAVINGCIYVAGGWNGKGAVKSVSKYCPETDTWREVEPMTNARSEFTLTPFSGRLWAIGGRGNNNQPLCSCESYDPVTDTWREEAPMKEKKWLHAAIEFNEELYVVGGKKKDDSTSVEKYLPSVGWVEDSTLQQICHHPLLLIIPPAFSSCFATDQL